MAEGFATRSRWEVFPHKFQAELLQSAQEIPSLALVGDGRFEPAKLLGAKGDRDGFTGYPTRPLVTWAALAGLGAFDQAAQSQPSQLSELTADAAVLGGQSLLIGWGRF